MPRAPHAPDAAARRGRPPLAARLLLPVLLLSVLLLAGLFGGCGLLGGDEDGVPERLSDGDREKIEETLRQFFDGVDLYNPQAAGEAMVTPAEIGIEDFARMAIEIGSLQSAELAYGFQSLGQAAIDVEADMVQATAVTGLGPVEVAVTRQDGAWLVARAPVLRPALDQLPYQYDWAITNHYRADETRYIVVGRFTNTGDSTIMPFSFAGALLGEDGRAVRADITGIVADPFVHPDEEAVFRVDLLIPEDVTFEADRFVLIPNARIARGSDEQILSQGISVTPAELDPAEAEGAVITITNGGTTPSRVFVLMTARDEGRAPLGLYGVTPGTLAGGESRELTLSGFDAEVLADATRIELSAWGSSAAE